jgi:hypothetical protein
MITKFRERWDKLKDSAKRKKDLRAAGLVSTASSGSPNRTVRETVISEEPEEEQAQDQVDEVEAN